MDNYKVQLELVGILNQIKGLQQVQSIIGDHYDPANNEEMNDLFCHLDHMISDMLDEVDEIGNSLERGD